MTFTFPNTWGDVASCTPTASALFVGLGLFFGLFFWFGSAFALFWATSLLVRGIPQHHAPAPAPALSPAPAPFPTGPESPVRQVRHYLPERLINNDRRRSNGIDDSSSSSEDGFRVLGTAPEIEERRVLGFNDSKECRHGKRPRDAGDPRYQVS